MQQPFLGQISVAAFNYAPEGWALCDGQILSVAQNPDLFAVIGATYGGDGVSTFGLPDLRGRAASHPGPFSNLGERFGRESVTLTREQIPSHAHAVRATKQPGNLSGPADAIWAASTAGDQHYARAATPGKFMRIWPLGPAGGGQPHENMPPFTVLNYLIALKGTVPSHVEG